MTEQSRKQTVLVVDDEPGNIRVLLELLRPDYDMLVATNGETALQIALSDSPPDLVLLDVVMPGIDGDEVCKRLQADARTKTIPIIFITGKSSEQDVIKGFELGAVDYVTKPFSPVVVKARVQTHTELKKHRDVLEGLSYSNGLTGIANRRWFDEYLASAWDFAIRESSPLSLIMIDIDHFKLFNDHYGHQAGDDCLKRISQALASLMRRKIDLVARYGGEEFGCILPKTDLDGAVLMAESFQEAVLSLHIPHAYSPANTSVTISQGVASVVPTRDSSPQVLIKAADEALYQSKQSGRNRVSSQKISAA